MRPKFSRLVEMAKAMAEADGTMNELLSWERMPVPMRNRYKLLAFIALQNARYTTQSQIARVQRRYVSLKEGMIRQVWKDMIDDIIGEHIK